MNGNQREATSAGAANPVVVAVAGLSSNIGKTTLACDLIEALPGWEAIKVTKGHYRSCGKDPEACCVSHLLSDAPLVMSGRRQTYVAGKDTGRFWDAGASNVHWVVATKQQVADGVREALARVARGCSGVLVEGTGFIRQVRVDLAIMVATAGAREIKASAAKAFPLADVLYLSRTDERGRAEAEGRVRDLLASRRVEAPLPRVVLHKDVPSLLAEIERRTGALSIDRHLGTRSDRSRRTQYRER